MDSPPLFTYTGDRRPAPPPVPAPVGVPSVVRTPRPRAAVAARRSRPPTSLYERVSRGEDLTRLIEDTFRL